MKINFDKKDNDIIIWNNQIVMSRSEENYFSEIFKFLSSKYKFNSVLEIGYGLGISAKLIQNYLNPQHHTIVEISDEIFEDLENFSLSYSGIEPCLSDWLEYDYKTKFDLIFCDPFDYATPSLEMVEKKFQLIRYLLKENGLYCIPHFGDGEPKTLPFLQLRDNVLLEVEPYILWNGEVCNFARILTYTKY
ncbi:class I SAM-dependent methyltransferase [Moraxella oblonga]|uniref:class I SAM-dependent methyltransferase n=1 Tax=Moraxella oblonga TaxID=200413 RepID=UPI00082B3669|nr:hypothetical protein [Moraxella oblonga]